jgi:predicted transcriptional regulator
MRRSTNQPSERSIDGLNDEEGFRVAIRQGLSELDRGESIPLEEVERELRSWIIK